MNNTETINHQLIAVFHQHPYFDDYDSFKQDYILKTAREYQTSWNTLMAVVTKIKSLGYRYYLQSTEADTTVAFTDMDLSIQSHNFGGGNLISLASNANALECTYRAVINFINYYNNQ